MGSDGSSDEAAMFRICIQPVYTSHRRTSVDYKRAHLSMHGLCGTTAVDRFTVVIVMII